MNWYKDPTQVPTPGKKNYGSWQYEYGRKKSGKVPGSTMSRDYGPREGEWVVKRKFVGEKPPGFVGGNLSRTLPASWDPTANQFPWTTRRGITSDIERQAAYTLGLGGGRMASIARKAPGTYFDPETGFLGRGRVTGRGSFRAPTKPAPSFMSFPQPVQSDYPWLSMMLNKNKNMMNYLRTMRGL